MINNFLNCRTALWKDSYHHLTLENEVKVWCVVFCKHLCDSVKIPELGIHTSFQVKGFGVGR